MGRGWDHVDGDPRPSLHRYRVFPPVLRSQARRSPPGSGWRNHVTEPASSLSKKTSNFRLSSMNVPGGTKRYPPLPEITTSSPGDAICGSMEVRVGQTTVGVGTGDVVTDVGVGTWDAVTDVGVITGDVVTDVGGGTRDAVTDVGVITGDVVTDVGVGTRDAVTDVGVITGDMVTAVGVGTRDAATDVGVRTGDMVTAVGVRTGDMMTDVGVGAWDAVTDVGVRTGDIVTAVGVRTWDAVTVGVGSGADIVGLGPDVVSCTGLGRGASSQAKDADMVGRAAANSSRKAVFPNEPSHCRAHLHLQGSRSNHPAISPTERQTYPRDRD